MSYLFEREDLVPFRHLVVAIDLICSLIGIFQPGRNATKSSQINQLKMGQHHEMSHAEIWDDSSLVDSWNEALEEYNVSVKCIT